VLTFFSETENSNIIEIIISRKTKKSRIAPYQKVKRIKINFFFHIFN